MKNISKYLGAGLLLFTAACSQTQEGDQYTPNKDDAKAIHFIQSSIQKEFPQDAVQGVINVEIARPGNKGAYKVYLATKDDDYELFSVPAEATIPDGSHSVTVPVEVDLSNFVMGSNYKTTLYISSREARPGDNAAQVAQYSDKVTLSATYELEWETLYRTTGEGEEIPQLATYHYNGYYSGRDSGLEVEKAVGANIFRLKDWASGVTFKFVLHDDNTCTVPAQSIGYYNSNYNEYVYVADMAVYTGNDSAYASYPCTFDGESTFSFYLIYYVSSGYFAQGTEKLVFDTDIDTTPVVEIAFEGIETTSTGFKAPKLHFSPNEYTKYYKAAVVAGDITADAERQQEVRRQLIDDKLEAVTPVVTLLADDASVWNVPSGNYTAVALAYDSIENPCKLYTQRFTNDPNDEYAPRSLEFEFYAPENNLNYSPYNTLIWQMQTANVAAMKYLCVKTAVADYLCEALGISFDALLGGEELCIALNDVELAFFQSRAQQLNLIARSAEEPDRLSVLVICEMLVHAISLLYKKWRPFSADCPEWMQALLQKIHSPEYISCSAADVYRLAGYSPPVVIQYFRQYTGDTVTAYLTKAKMDFACSLLLTTQMTTIEIACQLGYSSLSHFNKCFRNHTGKSPREYRRAAGSQGR